MEKLLFYDLETTGLSHKKNGIHQLSGAIIIDGKSVDKFNFKMKPHDSDEIVKEALDVSEVNVDIISKYEPTIDVFKKFSELLSKYIDKFDSKDKFHLVGYNNRSFDDHFLRSWFGKCGDKYFGSWFWADSIDVLVLASHYLSKERSCLANFKLPTVAEYLGIEVDKSKLHDAMYDVFLTMSIYKKLTYN